MQNTKSNIVKLYNKPLLLSTYKSLKCISNKNHTEREDDRFDYTKFYNESSLANEKENLRKQIQKNSMVLKEDQSISENISQDDLED